MQNDISNNLNKWNKISAYSEWMYSIYSDYIGKRVLDIGCGIGTMTQYYVDKCDVVIGSDIFQHQIDLMNERFHEKRNFKAILFDIMNDDVEKLIRYKFDTIICINTLEHLCDDYLAVKNMKQIISPGGGNNTFGTCFAITLLLDG